MTETENRGGKRPNSGPKTLYGVKMEARTVMMPAYMWQGVENHGAGNRSEGLRDIVSQFLKYAPPIKDG